MRVTESSSKHQSNNQSNTSQSKNSGKTDSSIFDHHNNSRSTQHSQGHNGNNSGSTQHSQGHNGSNSRSTQHSQGHNVSNSRSTQHNQNHNGNNSRSTQNSQNHNSNNSRSTQNSQNHNVNSDKTTTNNNQTSNPDSNANKSKTSSDNNIFQSGEKNTGSGTTTNGTGSTASSDSSWTAAQKSLNTTDQSNKVAGEYTSNLEKDFGLTKAQAAGVVGNLWEESGGMNSGIQQGGNIGQPSMSGDKVNETGYGIAQWGEDRKQGLIDYANANGLDPSSQAANYGYLKQELSGEYSGAISAVKGTNSVADATQAFMNAYEQPSDPELDSRVNYSNQIYSLA